MPGECAKMIKNRLKKTQKRKVVGFLITPNSGESYLEEPDVLLFTQVYFLHEAAEYLGDLT